MWTQVVPIHCTCIFFYSHCSCPIIATLYLPGYCGFAVMLKKKVTSWRFDLLLLYLHVQGSSTCAGGAQTTLQGEWRSTDSGACLAPQGARQHHHWLHTWRGWGNSGICWQPFGCSSCQSWDLGEKPLQAGRRGMLNFPLYWSCHQLLSLSFTKKNTSPISGWQAVWSRYHRLSWPCCSHHRPLHPTCWEEAPTEEGGLGGVHCLVSIFAWWMLEGTLTFLQWGELLHCWSGSGPAAQGRQIGTLQGWPYLLDGLCWY